MENKLAIDCTIEHQTEKAVLMDDGTQQIWLPKSVVEQAIEIQSQYAKRAYDAYVAEATKLGDWYADMVRNVSKPFDQTVAKKTA
jgi:hypothetical protein